MDVFFLLSLPGLVVVIIIAGVVQLARAKKSGKKRPGAASIGLNLLDTALRPGTENKIIELEKQRVIADQTGNSKMSTTGNFSSSELLEQEINSVLPNLDLQVVQDIGALATNIGLERNLGIEISIRLGDWEVFKAALPGSKQESDGWINRKANVVNLTQHSTMYERVKSEEDGIDWHKKHGVEDATHAIHGGGFPLYTKSEGFKGVLLISGLPQVEDHKLAVEILQIFLNR